MISIYRIFAPTFFNFEIIFALRFFLCLWGFPLGFYFQFSFWHSTLIPFNKVKDVVVAQPGPGNLCVWASGGSLWVHSNFVIRVPPEINTHSVTTFTTPEGGVLIIFSHISMELLDWLVSTIILSPNRVLPIVSFFKPIVVTDNKRCTILVFLVSSYWSVVDMDIHLVVFIPKWVINDFIAILSR